MDSFLTNVLHEDHIKDESFDEYERESAQEMRWPVSQPEPRKIWSILDPPEELGQTLNASYYDAHDMHMSRDHTTGGWNGAPLLQHPSASNGNTYHVPPFRYLLETASAGEHHLSSPPMVPTMQTRHEDRHVPQYIHRAPHMPPDSAFLHSRNLSLRNSSRPPGQYDLPRFPSQGTSYALDSGLAYPADMPAPCVVPRTMDPSTLLRGQISMPTIRAASVSDSEVEMDDDGDSDCGAEQRQIDDGDANDWNLHPDTIRVGNPDFCNTKTYGNVRDATGAQVLPKIQGRFVLKRKTARHRAYWILYRRNYFGVQASYSLDSPPNPSADERLYLNRDNQKPEPIKALFMCMRGVVESEDGPEISIVVFDAKRKPQHEGDEPPPIEPQRMKPSKERATKLYAKSTGDRLDNLKAPMNHTFPRNQFKCATQNNGARRSEQQTYHILLELKAEVVVNGLPQLFTVASQMSEPLVVRGRCPLSFKNKDRDGHNRYSDRRAKKVRKPREKGRNGNKGPTTKIRLGLGKKKEASRGFCNTISNQRCTRASSHVPSLIYETESRSTDTAPVSPPTTSRTNSAVDRQTIRSLDRKLIEYQDAIGEADVMVVP